jgi:hypothetical protein
MAAPVRDMFSNGGMSNSECEDDTSETTLESANMKIGEKQTLLQALFGNEDSSDEESYEKVDAPAQKFGSMFESELSDSVRAMVAAHPNGSKELLFHPKVVCAICGDTRSALPELEPHKCTPAALAETRPISSSFYATQFGCDGNKADRSQPVVEGRKSKLGEISDLQKAVEMEDAAAKQLSAAELQAVKAQRILQEKRKEERKTRYELQLLQDAKNQAEADAEKAAAEANNAALLAKATKNKTKKELADVVRAVDQPKASRFEAPAMQPHLLSEHVDSIGKMIETGKDFSVVQTTPQGHRVEWKGKFMIGNNAYLISAGFSESGTPVSNFENIFLLKPNAQNCVTGKMFKSGIHVLEQTAQEFDVGTHLIDPMHRLLTAKNVPCK